MGIDLKTVLEIDLAQKGYGARQQAALRDLIRNESGDATKVVLGDGTVGAVPGGGGGGGGSENLTSDNTTPKNCDPNVAITHVTSDGSGLSQHVVLPNFTLDGNGVNAAKCGVRHYIVVDIQANGADIVLTYPGADAGISRGSRLKQGMSVGISTGIILDYPGAIAIYEWMGKEWLWLDDGNNDTIPDEIYVGGQFNPFSGVITGADLATKNITVSEGVITNFA